MTDIRCKQCREKIDPKGHSPRPSDCSMIAQALDKARPWGLEAEVMWSAMVMTAEANEDGQTMQEVLETALAEWDI
jgi:hypothetical protein